LAEHIVYKKCPKCHELLALTTDNYYTCPTNGNGFRARCKPCEAITSKERGRTPSPNAKNNSRKWYDAHKDVQRARAKKWAADNPEKRSKSRKLEEEKAKANPRRMLHKRMNRRIRHALKAPKRRRSWCKILGYSAAELKQCIERQFTRGMTWEKFLKGEIHIDHIRPVASFTFSNMDDEGFKECFAMTNLRPLWSADNHSKSGKRLFLI
jgi:hypothetical protein